MRSTSAGRRQEGRSQSRGWWGTQNQNDTQNPEEWAENLRGHSPEGQKLLGPAGPVTQGDASQNHNLSQTDRRYWARAGGGSPGSCLSSGAPLRAGHSVTAGQRQLRGRRFAGGGPCARGAQTCARQAPHCIPRSCSRGRTTPLEPEAAAPATSASLVTQQRGPTGTCSWASLAALLIAGISGKRSRTPGS